MYFSLQLVASVLLDAVLGDPRWYPHPVRLIGSLCSFCEKIFRKSFANRYLGGLLTVVLVISTTALVVYTLLIFSLGLGPFFEAAAAIFLLYTTIAARDLIVHSNRVKKALETDSMERARGEVGKIVGRDTGSLGRDQVSAACIETVAENMVDGITAPLFFAVTASCFAFVLPLSAIGCAALGAMVYKAINTMDSMLGYKNEQYLEFGWGAARLDDLVNFVPARLSSLALIAAAYFLRVDYRGAARIFFRDRFNHSSPNAAHPEAAVAGALGIRLGGPSRYFGKIVEKQYIGDQTRPVAIADIHKTHQLVMVGSAVFLAAVLVARYLLIGSL